MSVITYKHKLIQKAIRRYNYNEDINQDATNEPFFRSYSFRRKGRRGKLNLDYLYLILHGTPTCNHIAAKNLLFQGHEDCWKFFDRTAQFYAHAYTDVSFVGIDTISENLHFALYVERLDLIEQLLTTAHVNLDREAYKNHKNYSKQEVYPNAYLIHFLIEKLGIPNPVKEQVLQYGDGLGIYERIVAEWDQPFSEIEDEYWNSLCEYHLNGIGVKGTKRKNEEFLFCGLVPMELINVFKVRQKLGLDVPVIKHELFSTPMAAYPKIPTGYDAGLDVKFQLVERTIRDQRLYTLEEIAEQLKEQYGESVELFY